MAIFRLLIEVGAAGLAAGEIGQTLGVTLNTLSSQLNVLANADLVTSRRGGRSIIHAADYDAMSALLLYRMGDACQDRPEVCAHLAAAASRAA